jgi:hypothetical protein
MPVGRMLREMSSSELTHWMAYSVMWPFGGEANDYRAGITAAMRINSQLKEGAEPIDPRALFPWFVKDDAPTADDAPDQVAANVVQLFSNLTAPKPAE